MVSYFLLFLHHCKNQKKNLTKGTRKMSNKGKRGKKEANNSQHSKRELITREDGQEYGLCITMLGCDQVKVHLFTGQDAIGMIRGKMVTRVKSRKLQPGNVVLCGTREFESRGLKVDILLHYTPDELVELQALGEIPRQNGSLSHGTITEATGRGHISFKRAKSEESLSRASHGWVMPLTDEDTDVDGITDNDDAHDVPDEMKLRSSKEDHHSAKRSHDERRALSSWNAQRLERAAATPDSMDSTEGEAPPYYEHHMMHPTAYEHGMSLVEEEEDTTPAHEDEVRRTEYQAWGIPPRSMVMKSASSPLHTGALCILTMRATPVMRSKMKSGRTSCTEPFVGCATTAIRRATSHGTALSLALGAVGAVGARATTAARRAICPGTARTPARDLPTGPSMRLLS